MRRSNNICMPLCSCHVLFMRRGCAAGCARVCACACVSDSVQAVLDAAGGAVRSAVKSSMLGRLQPMSRSKFGSNVVEKCLRQSSPAWRAALIRELCSQPLVAELLKDRYANYVLQTGLAVCPQSELAAMVAAIAPHLPSLRENVRSKWRQLIKRANSDTELAAHHAADAAAAGTPPQQPQPHTHQQRGMAGRTPSPPPFSVTPLSRLDGGANMPKQQQQ